MLFNQYPHLKTDRIILKQITETDGDDLYEIYSNESLFRLRPGNPKKSYAAVQNMISHFDRDFKKKKTLFLGVYLTESRKLIGICEVFDFDKKVNSVTIGYTVNEDYQGKGFATEATKLLIDYLFNEINVNRIQAFIIPQNTASIKVAENAGLVHEGTMRQCEYWTGIGIVDLSVFATLRNL
jgi:ribosomal-protein-alanine N-acetyltransferase